MNKFVVAIVLVLAFLAEPAQAHRFSTSFLQLNSGQDHPQEFDWSWRIVEHDLAVVAPFLVNNQKQLLPLAELADQQQSFADFVATRVNFNAECSLEVLPVVQLTREVYAGQEFVVIHGHGGCPLALLEKVQVTRVFAEIKDHKVIIEIGDKEKHGVLSQAQTTWQVE